MNPLFLVHSPQLTLRSPFAIFSTLKFRKAVEPACQVQPPAPLPRIFRPLPDMSSTNESGSGDARFSSATVLEEVPTADQLGLGSTAPTHPNAVMHFEGGETAGLRRVQQYIWEEDRLKEYKETRDGLLGSGFSSKFSPWLALGCLSPRAIVAEVRAVDDSL